MADKVEVKASFYRLESGALRLDLDCQGLVHGRPVVDAEDAAYAFANFLRDLASRGEDVPR